MYECTIFDRATAIVSAISNRIPKYDELYFGLSGMYEGTIFSIEQPQLYLPFPTAYQSSTSETLASLECTKERFFSIHFQPHTKVPRAKLWHLWNVRRNDFFDRATAIVSAISNR